MTAELYAPPPWRFDTPEARAALRRWWLRDPLRALLKEVLPHHALRLLPTDTVSALGARLSWDQERRRPVASERARAALRLMRPGADAQEIDRLLRAHWRHLGRCLAEFAALDRMWREGRVEVAGEEHLRAVQEAGRPLVIAGLHVGNWEVLHAGLAGLGIRFSGIYQRLPNRFQMRIVNAARHRCWPRDGRPVPIDPTPRALHAARRVLTSGRDPTLLYYVDENWGGRVQAPALGRPVSVAGNIAMAVRLASLTGAAVLPCYALRLNDTARFRLTFLPEVPVADRGGEADWKADIAALDAAIETIVRAHPEQWLMLHAFQRDR